MMADPGLRPLSLFFIAAGCWRCSSASPPTPADRSWHPVRQGLGRHRIFPRPQGPEAATSDPSDDCFWSRRDRLWQSPEDAPRHAPLHRQRWEAPHGAAPISQDIEHSVQASPEANATEIWRPPSLSRARTDDGAKRAPCAAIAPWIKRRHQLQRDEVPLRRLREHCEMLQFQRCDSLVTALSHFK